MRSRIRVLFVIGQLSVGGTELQLLQLAGCLNRHRFEPLVVCLSGDSASLVSNFQENNIPTIVLNREKQGRSVVLWKLAHIMKEFKPDIVHAFAYASRAAILVSKLLFKSKNIVSIRTQPGRQSNGLDKFLNSFADSVLTNSQKAAASIDFSFWRDVPVQVIYNGIDLQEFDAGTSGDIAPFVPNGTKIICAIGRLHPVKGLDILLNAFAILSQSLHNVQLWIVGDGQERSNLEDQAAHLGIDSKVFFWGHRGDIRAILRHAHVGVLSSRFEGLPNAVIEYMAAELPVVATDVGGVREIVLDGETGWLVLPGNPQILADKLFLVLSNVETARQFGIAGRKRIESYFTLERMVSETETLYQSVIGYGKI